MGTERLPAWKMISSPETSVLELPVLEEFWQAERIIAEIKDIYNKIDLILKNYNILHIK